MASLMKSSVYNRALSDQEIQGIYNTITGTSTVASLDSLDSNKDTDNANITPSTGITLKSFNAQVGHDGSVTLNWDTLAEPGTAGFNLYRSRHKNGTYTHVNNVPINAKGNAALGASYDFGDTPQRRGTYYYKLETVGYNGVSTMHGHVRVRAGR